MKSNNNFIQDQLREYINLANKFPRESTPKVYLDSLLSNFELNIIQNKSYPKLWDFIKFIGKCFLLKKKITLIGEKFQNGVIIWPVQFNHLDFLMPVYFELQKRVNVCFVSYRKEVNKIILEKGARLVSVEINWNFGFNINNVIRGIHIIRIIGQLFLNRRYNKPFRSAVIHAVMNIDIIDTYIEVYKQVKRIYQPRYHLLGYEFSIVCRPVNIMANRDHLQTGCIQHGVVNDKLINYSICRNQFVWDRLAYNSYMKSPIAMVHLTGSPNTLHQVKALPKNDSFINFISQIKREFKYVLLVCFSGPGHNVTAHGHNENIYTLEKAIKTNTEIFFIIKFHNKDELSYYQKVKHFKNVIIIDQKHEYFSNPIGNWIKASSCIITGASTVAIEALYQKKPLISMDLANEFNHIEFIQSLMIYLCKTEEAFMQAIHDVVNVTTIHKKKMIEITRFSEEVQNLLTNDPSKRIADLITKQINACVA